MVEIADPNQLDAAAKMRNLLSVYYANLDLVSIGAYKRGSNPKLDEALKKIDKINAFLKQGINESYEYDAMLKLLSDAVA
jgi:flagellum-specific ATP synthase